MEPTSCIIIGGGPAGLLAAARLSDAGVRTTLLEARAGLGGRAASDHRNGFDLNQGPHALYVGGAAMRELRALGVDPPRWNPVSITGSLLLTLGRPHRAVGGPRTLATLTRWMRRLRGGSDGLAATSTAAWLDAELPDPRARQIAAGLVRVTTYVADHDSLSADVAATQVKLGAWPGVRYVTGGWQRLVDDLAEHARRRGADVRTRAAVRALEPEAGGWMVHTDDDELQAGAVVLAAGGPATVAKLLGDVVTAPGPAAQASTLDLGLRRLPRPSRRFALGTDAPTYLSKHSPPRHPDGVLLTVAGYGGLPRAELEAVADAVQPGWREELVMPPRYLPRMTSVAAIATPQSGGLAGRPGVTVAGAPGVFVAGDWIGPEGWLLDAALASGAAAARAVVAPVRTTAAA